MKEIGAVSSNLNRFSYVQLITTHDQPHGFNLCSCSNALATRRGKCGKCVECVWFWMSLLFSQPPLDRSIKKERLCSLSSPVAQIWHVGASHSVIQYFLQTESIFCESVASSCARRQWELVSIQIMFLQQFKAWRLFGVNSQISRRIMFASGTYFPVCMELSKQQSVLYRVRLHVYVWVCMRG